MKWWDATWNTITGCAKVSPACVNCWAEERTNALSGHAAKLSRGFGEVVLHERCLDDPRKWRRPRKRIFVNNMSDTFHAAVPDAFILRHLDVVLDCPRHSFLFCTKRSERLRDFTRAHFFPANAWAGVTVESEAYLYRVAHLRAARVDHRFLSIEPLLEPLPALDLTGIDWVIVGGEKAASPRPMRPEWVREIRDKCKASGVPFLFKQWGGRNTDGGHLLDGVTFEEYPEMSRISHQTRYTPPGTTISLSGVPEGDVQHDHDYQIPGGRVATRKPTPASAAPRDLPAGESRRG